MQRSASLVDFKLYKEVIQCLQVVKEDARFHRQLQSNYIRDYAVKIVDAVFPQGNLLQILRGVKYSGEYEVTHPANVAIVAVFIGKWLEMSKQELVELAYAGLIADIGKTKIRDSLLYKETELTNEDWELIRTHPTKGFGMIAKNQDISGGIKMAVLSHHERHDGSGYPFSIKGDEIHPYARIIAVADMYDAMTSHRVYSNKTPIFSAVREIVDSSFETLDPVVCQTFFRKICECYIGSTVILNNNVIGEIIYVNPLHPHRPLIRHEEHYYDLFKDKSLHIIDMV